MALLVATGPSETCLTPARYPVAELIRQIYRCYTIFRLSVLIMEFTSDF